MSSSSGVNDSSGNTAPLFVHLSTLHCACDSLCIPCFYKIFPNGSTAMFNNTSTTPVELSDTVLKLPANVRPENCPRAKAYTNASTAPHSRNTNTTTSLYQGLYHSNTEKILIVGDGDLSFALSIATYLQQQYGSARKLIATTHESYDSVCTTYTDGLKHITTLQSLGAKVYHEVDATNLSAFHVIDDQTFDYILWNFPCIRVEKGADGQVSELDQNIQLLQRFFQNAHHYLVDKVGEVHVAHKTIEPFSWWKIADIAAAQDFTCVGKVIFDR